MQSRGPPGTGRARHLLARPSLVCAEGRLCGRRGRGGPGSRAPRVLTGPSPSAEQNYCESRYHFLHSTDGEGCANMLVEYSTSRGFRSEVDMFVAQAVLQ